MSRLLVAVAFSALFACDSEDEGLAEGALSADRVLADGTPEAIGVLTMLNDATITQPRLDDDAGLEKRAATNLIAHRNGTDGGYPTGDDDHFDSIDEVDAVAYVGDAALSALLAYATAEGYIEVDDDYYGTIETVTFSQDQAANVVDLCNTASADELDVQVGLDSRAATNLVADRPFTTLEEVAAVSYVGASALQKLRDYQRPADTLGTDEALTKLATVVDGLWYSSESDYRLTPFAVRNPSSTVITSSNVKAAIASAYVQREDSLSLAERTIEPSSLGWMFDRLTVTQDWWEDENREMQPRWQAVRSVLEDELDDTTVWRFGRQTRWGLAGDIDVFVIGVSADGDLVGVFTVVVET